MYTRFPMLATAAAATLFLAACGGDGGSPAAPATPSTTISGSVVKGPVSGATVTVKNAATGAVLGTTTTSNGSYSLSVPFTGDVVIEVTGGTYDDEATPGVDATPLSSTLRTVLTANGGTVTGVVTPLTTMAYTYAFGTSGTPTASAFNTTASALATQFQLSGVNLATTVPVVTGTLNDYGKILAAISQYLRSNSVTLGTLTTTALNSTQWTDFSVAFTNAYHAAIPNSNITFNFTGNGLTVGGTGAGGGSGSCGVNVRGTVSANGFNVPLDLNYCIVGIAAGSCNSGNASLSQGLSGQSGLVGAANLVYTYSTTCAAGAFEIRLQ